MAVDPFFPTYSYSIALRTGRYYSYERITGRPPKSMASTALSRLIELVGSGAVKPLRGSYAIHLARSGKPLPNKVFEPLPEKAFWTAAQLTELLETLTAKFGSAEAERRLALVFVAVSCHWLTEEHPDPDGFHLNAVAQFSHSYIAGSEDGASSSDFPALRSEIFEPIGSKPDCALLWDYVAVPDCKSEDRSEWAVASQEALALWLLHPQIALWTQTDTPRAGTRGLPELAGNTHERSGWCFTERMMAEQSKPNRARLDLGNRPPLPTLAAIASSGAPALNPPFRLLAAVCTSPRGAPLLPQGFIGRLGTSPAAGQPPRGPRFPNASDRDLACRMYAAAFEAAAASTAALDFHESRWEVAEVEALLAALPHFTACAYLDVSCGPLRISRSDALTSIVSSLPGLATLITGGSWVDAEVAPGLAEGLRSARSLTSLSLDASGLQDPTAVVLLRALASKSGLPLQSLSLRDNELALEACSVLTSLVAASTRLGYLDVACNDLTLAGTDQAALSELLSTGLRRTSPLTTLLLGGNALGTEALATVTTALATNTVITNLDVRTSVALPAAAATKLAAAVLSSPSLSFFGGVPLSAVGAGAVTQLDLGEQGLGASEAYVLGELVLGSSHLQSVNVDGHELLPLSELRGQADTIDLSRAGNPHPHPRPHPRPGPRPRPHPNSDPIPTLALHPDRSRQRLRRRPRHPPFCEYVDRIAHARAQPLRRARHLGHRRCPLLSDRHDGARPERQPDGRGRRTCHRRGTYMHAHAHMHAHGCACIHACMHANGNTMGEAGARAIVEVTLNTVLVSS